MTNFSDKPTMVIISSFKFSQYDYERFEVGEYKKYMNVEILDISRFVDPVLSKGTSAKKYIGNDISIINTGFELFNKFLKYHKKKGKTVVLSLVQPFNIQTLKYFFLLKAFNIPYIELYTSGCPIIPEENKIVNRLIKYKTQPKFLAVSLRSKISSYIYQLFRLYPACRLVAGNKNYGLYGKTIENNNGTVLFGSSNDYVMYLKKKNFLKRNLDSQEKIGVLLDGVAPMFGSDAITFRKTEPFTADAWYLSMVRFLDSLENEMGVKIKVAAHPKSNHSSNPPYLGSRDVLYGKAIELIFQSDFVIARNSASIAWGILFNKPVIFVYSDQLESDDKFMRSINHISGLVGATPVNIDKTENYSNVSRFLAFDENMNSKYVADYLTSRTDGKSNSAVIMEEMFGEKRL